MAEKIDAVQRMQNYIEDHIFEEIKLGNLAKAAHFSPWYSAKIFKEITKLSPAEYIRKLRLAKSALRLRDENIKIIDVALDSGFESVDGYQRAFFREFGCNPKKYAKHPKPLSLFTPYGVKFKDLWKEEISTMKNLTNVFIQVIEKPARKVIVKRGIKADDYLEYCNEVGCDIWGMLVSMKSLCGEPVCLYLPEKYIKKGTSKYVQGVEVSMNSDCDIPEGFDVIYLPASSYLMFQGEPFKEEDYCEAIQDVRSSMQKYDPTAIGYKYDDDNPRIQLEPRGNRGYIELRAVKKL